MHKQMQEQMTKVMTSGKMVKYSICANKSMFNIRLSKVLYHMMSRLGVK